MDIKKGWEQNMMRLRPYKPSDAKALLSWLKEERTVELWKADRFCWPLMMEQVEQYWNDFLEDSHAFLFTALDESGQPVGHFSFRNADYEKNCIHMGFIVVDPETRGKGYGRQMVFLALSYAFEILGMDKVTLGVFDCNEAAKRCYTSAGFKEINREHKRVQFYDENWEYFYMAAVRKTV